MRAFKFKVSIPDDRRLAVDVPEEVPAGPAEVIILAPDVEAKQPPSFKAAAEDLIAHRWTPSATAPDSLTLLREDRDR